MHILFAIQRLRLSLGGAERFTLNLIRNLKARGHRITVACHDWDEKAEKLDLEFLRIPRGRRFHNPWFEYARNFQAALEGSGLKPDVVCGLTQVFPQDVHRFGGGIYSYWLPEKYGCLWPLYKWLPKSRAILDFERRLYSPGNLRYAVAISEMDRRILQEHYAFPPERILTIYNGIDQEEFHNRGREEARRRLVAENGLDPERRLVLFSANNYRRKGLPEAVEALLRTADPSRFALVVIGKPDKWLRSRLKAKIGGRFQNVWLSHVDNPAEYYRGSDLMIFPTHYDSFANVTSEALLCGLPLITTRQAGGAEMVLPGVNGFVAERSGDLDGMAAALDKLLDPAVLAEFSAHAPDLAKELTWERCAARFEELFARVAAEKGR